MKTLARAVVASGVALALLGPALPVRASHLELEAVGPGEASVGETIQIRVVVRSADSGERIPGANVVAFREATLAGYSGQVEVAQAVTDEIGLATLQWVVRGGSTETVLIAYSAPGEEQFESEPVSVLIVGSGSQLERSTAGVRIPGLGAWVVIGVLVGIWAVIQFALIGPMRVAWEGALAGDENEPSLAEERLP